MGCTDGNWNYCGDFIMYKNIKPLCCTRETNRILCVKCNLIKKLIDPWRMHPNSLPGCERGGIGNQASEVRAEVNNEESGSERTSRTLLCLCHNFSKGYHMDSHVLCRKTDSNTSLWALGSLDTTEICIPMCFPMN